MNAPQLIAWAAAFGVGGALFARQSHAGIVRFVLGLWAGALFAHLGWGLLHLEGLLRHPGALLRPGAASVLFVPLGILVCAPWREALATLPLTLCVARFGCLPYTCCYASPWHAVPELVSLAVLHLAACAWPRQTAPIVLAGFGAIRLATEPLRVPPTDIVLSPDWVALAWIALAFVAGRHVPSVREVHLPTPRPATVVGPVLRMLCVWGLFPLSGALIHDRDTAFLAACGGATALVAIERGRPTVFPRPGFALGLAMGALAGFGIAAAAHALLWIPGSFDSARAGTRAVTAMVGLSPIFEEMLYRKQLLRTLQPICGPAGAVLATSALGAVAHVQPTSMAAPFVLGLANGALVLWTRSLSLAIGIHVGWNLAVFIYS